MTFENIFNANIYKYILILGRSATSERKRERSRDNFLEEPEVEFDFDDHNDHDDVHDDDHDDRDDICRPPP